MKLQELTNVIDPSRMETRPLMWKGSHVQGYYIREDGYLTNSYGHACAKWKIKGRDYSYIRIEGKGWTYRIDYMVAYTYIGMYDDAIRLIHLDGDLENCHHRNLMWYRKLDVYDRYRELAIIESDGSIKEEWRPCQLEYNHTLKYEVSNLGMVRDENHNPVPIYDNHGYRVFYYLDESPAKQTRVKSIHRAVAESFIPNPNHFPLVNHLDGNKMNDVVLNLEWADTGMNSEHAYLQNLNQNVQYTPNQIHAVCKLLVDKVAHVQIAMLTGVDRKTISDIYCGRRWKDVSSQYTMPEKKWTKERKEQIAQMIIDGMKGSEIFKELGIEYDQSAISMYERSRRELKAAGKIA